MPQWSPAFGAGKSAASIPGSSPRFAPQWSPAFGAGKSLRMIPGRKRRGLPQWSPAFGAGKRRACFSGCSSNSSCRNGAQLLELGKATVTAPTLLPIFCRNGAQLLELGKESSRFFHQLTTSVAHLCEQRKFWGRRVGLLLPDRLGKLALTRARALPRGTEGAGALARRSAGLGWVAPRGLQRI